MPSPKVHPQIPEVKAPPLILRTAVIAIGWCYKVRFLLKAPCVAEESLVDVINHPDFLFLYVPSVNTFLWVDLISCSDYWNPHPYHFFNTMHQNCFFFLSFSFSIQWWPFKTIMLAMVQRLKWVSLKMPSLYVVQHELHRDCVLAFWDLWWPRVKWFREWGKLYRS